MLCLAYVQVPVKAQLASVRFRIFSVYLLYWLSFICVSSCASFSFPAEKCVTPGALWRPLPIGEPPPASSLNICLFENIASFAASVYMCVCYCSQIFKCFCSIFAQKYYITGICIYGWPGIVELDAGFLTNVICIGSCFINVTHSSQSDTIRSSHRATEL